MTRTNTLLTSLLLVAVLVGFVGPAASIETASWGITVADGDAPAVGQAFHIDATPGGRDHASVWIWNKTRQPVTLKLSATGAEVVEGRPALGGSGFGVDWVRVPEQPVVLASLEAKSVGFEIRMPRDAPLKAAVVAILAEPVIPGGATPAVVERLAVTAFLTPDGSRTVAAPRLGILPWVAAALVVTVAGGLSMRVARAGPGRRRQTRV